MRKLPKIRRSKVIRGENSRYYRCQNCGFICDKERDTLSDRSGIRTLGVYLVSEDNKKIYEEDGVTPILLEDSYWVVSGCPFCGTGSWKVA